MFANELIIFNPKTQVGSEDGFIPEGTYYSMARNGQLIVLRRGIPGCPALVDFETMRKDVKKEYIVRKGDPRAEIAAKTQKSILEDAIVYSNAAYEFFSVKYRYDGDKKLPPAKIDEYTLNVRIMNALLSLRDGRKANSIGGGSTRINVWEKLCKLSNDLLTPVSYTHLKLPTT
mgnify:FL=1